MLINIKPHKIYKTNSCGTPLVFYSVGSRIPVLCFTADSLNFFCVSIDRRDLEDWEETGITPKFSGIYKVKTRFYNNYNVLNVEQLEKE